MDRWLTALTGATPYRHWLQVPGSLTRALMGASPAFNVGRLRQELDRPCLDEHGPLGLPYGRLAMIREVLLRNGDTPLVFAHSVVPRPGLAGPWVKLAGLGNRPLGATLFANPRIRRQPLAFLRLDRRHPLFQSATRHLAVPARHLWARRSLFSLDQHPILVTEVFLPAILELPIPELPILEST